MSKTIDELNALVAAQEALIGELVRALKKYGDHEYDCPSSFSIKCECGFSDVLAKAGVK